MPTPTNPISINHPAVTESEAKMFSANTKAVNEKARVNSIIRRTIDEILVVGFGWSLLIFLISLLSYAD